MFKEMFFATKDKTVTPAEPKQPEPSTEKPVAAKEIKVDPEAERERQLLDRDIPRHDRIDVSRISLYEPSPTTMPVRKVETFTYNQSTCDKKRGSYCCNSGGIVFIDKQGTPWVTMDTERKRKALESAGYGHADLFIPTASGAEPHELGGANGDSLERWDQMYIGAYNERADAAEKTGDIEAAKNIRAQGFDALRTKQARRKAEKALRK